MLTVLYVIFIITIFMGHGDVDKERLTHYFHVRSVVSHI